MFRNSKKREKIQLKDSRRTNKNIINSNTKRNAMKKNEKR